MTQKITFVFLFLFLFSCSKKNNETPVDTKPIEKIDAYRYQLVKVDMGSISLTENSYAGVFASKNITLSKISDTELSFYVSENTPLGDTELAISTLGNYKKSVRVNDVKLSQTVEETIKPLFTNFNNHKSKLANTSDNQPFLKNYAAMETYYSNLSVAEKEEVAKFYQTNKQMIDAIFLTDYSAITGKQVSNIGDPSVITPLKTASTNRFLLSNPNNTVNNIDFDANRALVLRYKAALAVSIISTTVAIIEPAGLIKPIAAGIAIAAIKSAYDYHADLIDNNIKIIGLTIDSYLGTTTSTNSYIRTEKITSSIANNGVLNGISLFDNEEKTLSFSISSRPLIDNDASGIQPSTSLFFTCKNNLTKAVQNINTTIDWVNANVPFLPRFDKLPLPQLAANPSATSIDVNTAIMTGLKFSLNNANLTLENATLKSTGQLALKVKAKENTTLPISTELNYTYTDDFGKFSGKIPVIINKKSICGDLRDIDGNNYKSITIGDQCWMQSNLNVSKYRNGDLIPQVQNPAEWSMTRTGAWCYYENTNGSFGKLYNYYAFMDPRGLAPEGWHIPTNDEWVALATHLGGINVAGGKMKATTTWLAPNTGATNESGFYALGGGLRSNNGDYLNLNRITAFASYNYIWYRALNKDSQELEWVINNNVMGVYVRCIKD